jgi:hypothetical protein
MALLWLWLIWEFKQKAMANKGKLEVAKTLIDTMQ